MPTFSFLYLHFILATVLTTVRLNMKHNMNLYDAHEFTAWRTWKWNIYPVLKQHIFNLWFVTPTPLSRFKQKCTEHIWTLFTKLSLLFITFKYEQQWLLTSYVWWAYPSDSEVMLHCQYCFISWQKKVMQVKTGKSRGKKKSSCFSSIYPVVFSKTFFLNDTSLE